MATYAELEDRFNDPALKTKVRVAVIVAAQTIFEEDPGTTNHANRLLWAKRAYEQTEAEALTMLKAVLAANKDATTGQIDGASDATVQSAVDAVVDLFANGGA